MMLKNEPELLKPHDSNGSCEPKSSDYHRLRSLVLGDEYEKILSARATDSDINRVSEVLTEAFKRRRSKDDSLAREMSPVIESAIDESIKTNPQRITQVIFPIIGPAVRKAVTTALADLMQSLNYLLQNSLSIKSLIWRFKAWRLGVDYGEYLLMQSIQYQVEQVFFIHRESGLLLQSVQAQGIDYKDPDLVSSMLSAISDFVKDSFEQESAGLDIVQMGDLSLLIEAGPHAVVAMAIRGSMHGDLKTVSSQLVESLHAKYAKELKAFDGATEVFEPTQALLKDALIKRHGKKEEGQDAGQEKVSKPWLAIIAVTIMVMVMGYFSYQNYLLQRSIEQIILNVNQQPGYRVLSSHFQKPQLTVDVLRSGLATPVKDLQDKLSLKNIQLLLKDTLASIDDFEIYLPYLSQKYQANLSIAEGSRNKVIVAGKISQANLMALQKDHLIVSMFELAVAEDIRIIAEPSLKAATQQVFIDKVQSINSQLYYFETASAMLTETSQSALIKQILNIKDIIELQQVAGFNIVQIGVFGFADAIGSEAINLELSQQRAQVVKSALSENGIMQKLIVIWGAGSVDSTNVPIEHQRRAKIEILYTDVGVTGNGE